MSLLSTSLATGCFHNFHPSYTLCSSINHLLETSLSYRKYHCTIAKITDIHSKMRALNADILSDFQSFAVEAINPNNLLQKAGSSQTSLVSFVTMIIDFATALSKTGQDPHALYGDYKFRHASRNSQALDQFERKPATPSKLFYQTKRSLW